MVVDVLAKLDKRERKRKEQELKATETRQEDGGVRAPLSMEELARKA